MLSKEATRAQRRKDQERAAAGREGGQHNDDGVLQSVVPLALHEDPFCGTALGPAGVLNEGDQDKRREKFLDLGPEAINLNVWQAGAANPSRTAPRSQLQPELDLQ